MSRTVIVAVVAAVIIALTAIAYFVTSHSFEDRARRDADEAIKRAYNVVGKLNQLEGIDVSNKAERLASEPEFLAAIKASGEERKREAQLGFQKFVATDKSPTKPDIMALVDKSGDVLAMHDVPTVVPKQWKNDKGEIVIPSIKHVLASPTKMIVTDFWNPGDSKGGMMRIGVAPIIDPDETVTDPATAGAAIKGAVIIAYSETTQSAQDERALIGAEVAYFDGKRVVASSFTRGETRTEDTRKARALADHLGKGTIAIGKGKQHVTLGDDEYLAAALSLERSSTKELAKDYPAVTAGAVVLAPIVASATAGTVKMFILLLGAGSLAIALLGLYLSHRRLIAQVDQVEMGVTDIINGNVDRTFRPVGEELDGLSNGLNVMLARLLGRPEPGEEEFDEEGNPIIPGRVEFDEGEGGGQTPAVDPDIAALAQESEPDYYKRVYTEYLAAKRATGKPDDVSFENFIAKLKVNEGKLRAQFQCRAVRFRVVTKDGKVTLKPVPIFA